MIPVSLLLILVAVALLALGLTSGSSGLLIASIVASLLAAVALVIGARRNAGARRTASPATRPAAPAEPGFDSAFAAAQAAAPGRSANDFSAPPPPAAAESVTYTEEPAGPAFAEEPPDSAFTAERAYPDAADQAFTAERAYPPAPDPAFGTEPSDPAFTAPPPAASGDDVDFGLDDDEAPWQTREQVYATQATPEAEVAAATGPDYDRAATAIHAARSEQPDDNAWRRDTHAEAAVHAGGLGDDFAEPDSDDPDDEPLPQSVQPADAVRVARMGDEVLVVDGRPRYHLADCPHLVGRLTEPIPVNEAVELGFSPCGLCRPVDRLVAAAARR
jgi:hypothetical protein